MTTVYIYVTEFPYEIRIYPCTKVSFRSWAQFNPLLLRHLPRPNRGHLGLWPSNETTWLTTFYYLIPYLFLCLLFVILSPCSKNFSANFFPQIVSFVYFLYESDTLKMVYFIHQSVTLLNVNGTTQQNKLYWQFLFLWFPINLISCCKDYIIHSKIYLHFLINILISSMYHTLHVFYFFAKFSFIQILCLRWKINL